MTHEQLIQLAADEPQTVKTTASALRHVINFRKGRGAMLARLSAGAL